MAKPFTVHKSRHQLPVAVANPIALMWNNTILVITIHDESLRDVVFINKSGEWIKKKTRGIVPGDWYFSDYTAQVIKDKMYLFVRQYKDFRGIYCLDLNNWTWTELTTSGPDCSGGGGLLPSWVYKEKMYHYVDQELFCYDVSNNIWEWHRLSGELPSHHSGCLAIINEDTVFLFKRIEGLFILDMENKFCTKVHGDARKLLHITHCSLTLTKVSQSTAILIGEADNSMVCWLLDLHKAKQFMQPSSIWTKILLHSPVISNYAIILEPREQELMLIGGMRFGSTSGDVLRIPTRIPTLMSLAIDCAARNTCTFDQSLLPDQLPVHLQSEVLALKQEMTMTGNESVCTKREGCIKCQIHQSGFVSPPKKRRSIYRQARM